MFVTSETVVAFSSTEQCSIPRGNTYYEIVLLVCIKKSGDNYKVSDHWDMSSENDGHCFCFVLFLNSELIFMIISMTEKRNVEDVVQLFFILEY